MRQEKSFLITFLLMIFSFFIIIQDLQAIEDEENPSADAQISVIYHEYMVRNLPSSPQFLNDQIGRIRPEEVDSSGEIYLEKGERVSICIKKDGFDEEEVQIQLVEESYSDDSKNIVWDNESDGIRWMEGEDNQYYAYMDFFESGHYRMVISYGSYEKESLYISPLITIDDREPEVEKFTALTEEINRINGIPVYKESVSYEVILKEENFHPGFFSWKGLSKKYESMITMSPWETYYEDGCRKNRTMITIGIPGINHLVWECSDGGGRYRIGGSLDISIDNTKPVLSITSDKNQLCKDWGYEDIQYFSKKPVSFKLVAEDKESGIKAIEYSIWSRGKKIKESYVENRDLSESFSLTISLKDKDFCGWVCAKAINGVDKESQEQVSDVFLWESQETADYFSKMKLLVPRPAYYDSGKNISYYKEDVTLELDFKQSYAGVRECGFTVEEAGRWKDIEDHEFAKKTVGKKHRSLHLAAKNYGDTFDKNPIHIRGICSDNAGYWWNSEEQFIVIDQKQPLVNVEYHTEENQYRKDIQYATVTVEDRNFDEKSVKWNIQGNPYGYQIGKWQGKGKKHYCKVTFQKDGTYRLGLQVSDYAKNITNWMDENTFILDTTPPQIRLWMDDSDVSNGKYYKKAKKVYLFVREENLHPEGITIKNCGRILNVSLEKEEKFLRGVPRLFEKRGWKVYSVLLAENKRYDLSYSCKDMAGNVARVQRYPSFVIDCRAPLVKNIDISDGITYTGEISAQIIIEDQNLIANTCKITPYFENGKKADFLEKYMERSLTKEGMVCFTLRDLPRKKSMDNRYQLKIEGEDLAGNDIEERKILFYVDRYGARYQLNKDTEDYLKRAYVREAKEMSVNVFSLHPLETDILVTKDNESFRTLSLKKKEYDIRQVRLDGKEQENSILPFHHEGWYQTSYHISKNAFREEGTYRIIFRSREYASGIEGRILTESENGLWTGTVEFIVDKTPPTVILGGLNEEKYDDSNHQFTITAMDNTKLKKVRVHFGKNNDKYVEIHKDYSGEEFNENHSITGKIMEWEGVQSIWYEAWDYAGNHMALDQNHPARKIVIAKNPITQAYYVHPAKMALYILGIVIIILMVFILTRRHFFAILKRVYQDYKEQ